MCSGKTTALNVLHKELQKNKDIYVQYIKFAGPLYEMQDAIYDIAKLPKPKEKDRKLLQYLGTEWGRSISQTIWVDIFKRSVEELNNPDAFDFCNLFTNVIVTNDDTRFDNEAQAIKELGGIVVRIVGRAPAGETAVNTGHSSECGVSDEYVDFVIDNSGSLEQLEMQIKALLF